MLCFNVCLHLSIKCCTRFPFLQHSTFAHIGGCMSSDDWLQKQEDNYTTCVFPGIGCCCCGWSTCTWMLTKAALKKGMSRFFFLRKLKLRSILVSIVYVALYANRSNVFSQQFFFFFFLPDIQISALSFICILNSTCWPCDKQHWVSRP